jgi:hypothetical protein
MMNVQDVMMGRLEIKTFPIPCLLLNLNYGKCKKLYNH